jgi:hypothetical protein
MQNLSSVAKLSGGKKEKNTSYRVMHFRVAVILLPSLPQEMGEVATKLTTIPHGGQVQSHIQTGFPN